MKTTQYVRLERQIAASAVNDIRDRWLWGLRLLRDPEAFAPGSTQMKPGRVDELLRAAKAAGMKLSEREIRYRLQCARAYPTESQIRHAGAEFEDWTSLRAAGFPPFDAPEGEPPADHRTEAERKRDHARALAEHLGDQGALFPLSDFEPITTTLKELTAYAAEMAELTERFAARDRERQAYLNALIAAADGDLSMTWQDAHDRLGAETP
ncbi:hypothetical protein [Micromonospora aurantiaca (nom. illeg.)]|uniref:hypothetical protein n=1 Tax=Micromonospora aurantiaca (nom. illeg.) TaxID=47850 RepID=UPI00340BDCED